MIKVAKSDNDIDDKIGYKDWLKRCFDCKKEFSDDENIYILLTEPMPLAMFSDHYCEKCYPKHEKECMCLECNTKWGSIKAYFERQEKSCDFFSCENYKYNKGKCDNPNCMCNCHKEGFVKRQTKLLKKYQKKNDWMTIIPFERDPPDFIDKIYRHMHIKLKTPIRITVNEESEYIGYFYFRFGIHSDNWVRREWKGVEILGQTKDYGYLKIMKGSPIKIACENMADALKKFGKMIQSKDGIKVSKWVKK